MRRDTIYYYSARGFLECFLYDDYVHTWECPGWKKNWKFNWWGGGGEVGGGIRMSWVEKFRKINERGAGGGTSVSDLRVVLFCREHFSFATRFFLLPQLTLFCRQIFSLAVTYFFCAARAFLLPRVFFFCLDLYLFCREHFSFTGSFFLLPWHLLATVPNRTCKQNIRFFQWK